MRASNTVLSCITITCQKESSETTNQQETCKGKGYMVTLEAVGLHTATYTGDTDVEIVGDEEMNGNEETEFDTDGDDVGYGDDDYDNDEIDNGDKGNNSGNNALVVSLILFPTHAKPLIFLFNCETTTIVIILLKLHPQ